MAQIAGPPAPAGLNVTVVVMLAGVIPGGARFFTYASISPEVAGAVQLASLAQVEPLTAAQRVASRAAFETK